MFLLPRRFFCRAALFPPLLVASGFFRREQPRRFSRHKLPLTPLLPSIFRKEATAMDKLRSGTFVAASAVRQLIIDGKDTLHQESWAREKADEAIRPPRQPEQILSINGIYPIYTHAYIPTYSQNEFTLDKVKQL
jgi:hypothetical protein